MVNIRHDLTMVVGGRSDNRQQETSQHSFSKQSFIYNHATEKWTNTSELNEARAEHAAGLIIDDDTQERIVAVTGGFTVLQGCKNGQNSFLTFKLLQDVINRTPTKYFSFLYTKAA